LSAGGMVRFVLPLSVLNAEVSLFLKFSLGREELFIVLTVSFLPSSAISRGTDSTAFSTPGKMSSIDVEHGVD